ncbi:MarR family winged helix-turn-helix transcriptional regulator [Saccharopolyspora rosea]|uniref:MarR family winged helix-turn-helix transcriptional regulator n=1 Tax=Saccharopolyspora rosea TaxID=524884 RepID=A0ABW3FZB8_9PSEU|nr:MarR family winged helix-turn-helix transcriptional regulator [Saccharopolyspora rosea]
MVDKRVLPPEELGTRLADVYAVIGPLYRRVGRLVEQQAPPGLPIGVRAVLEYLVRTGEAAAVPRMARDLALSRQFVQRMVNEALEGGHVALKPNPAHRRSSLVEPTDSGREAINAVLRHEQEAMGQVGGDLTEDEVAATVRVLRHMLAGLGEVDMG